MPTSDESAPAVEGQRPRSSLDPTLDIVFKMLFGAPESTDALVALLTAVLQPTSPIVEVTVLNPEVPREQAADKGIVLDLRIKLADGRLSNVEMQAHKRAAFRERAVYYWARLYAGQLERGQPYTALAPVISVLFLGYRELEGPRFHHTFQIADLHDGTVFTPALQIHTIELPKRGEASAAARQAEPALLAWCKFLGATTEEEVQEACMDQPDIEKANRILANISATPSARRLAEERERAHATYQIEMGAARSEGETKGRAGALLEQLRTKFGAIDQEMERRVHAAPSEVLSRWLRNVLTATTLTEALSESESAPEI